ncbi:ABC transporter permease [uncultured Marinobacter sp.]|uniref:ABC transporter permease n=1 Tax=uncultured Marinobacter sp. TaxID=187379 RepID=UPI0025884591|nr:ABC transporter permease [uncultured Marinobacter sp.]
MWHDLIVELHGKGHPETQSLVVWEKAGAEGAENANPRLPEGELDHTGLNTHPSTLHVWPWLDQPESRLMMRVNAQEGPPIDLPLLDTVTDTKWQNAQSGQHHVILPVVPFDYVRGFDLGGRSPNWPVLARTGYVYLFRNARLWRELRVVWENSQLQFYDVRLDDFRNEDGRITTDQRPPAGVALSDIWVPFRLDGEDQELEVAFVESPLPAARINRLQSDFNLRYYRCQQIKRLLPHQTPVDGAMIGNVPDDRPVFYLNDAAPQRPREPATEWQFERPWQFLSDLSGSHAEDALAMAEELRDQYEADERNEPLQAFEKPEPGALALCIQQRCDEGGTASKTRFFANKDWQRQPVATDVLEPLRQRGVCGLNIDDRLYELRHQAHRVRTAQTLLALCGERAGQSPHLDSAKLVSQLILPSRLQGDPNPLYEHASALPEQGRHRMDRLLMTDERTLGREYLERAQDELLQCLRRQPYQQVLGDLFSSEGFDYAAAFQFTGQLISLVLESPIKQDPLHPEQGQPGTDTPGKQWLRGLCTEHEAISQSRGDVSLARMLWPQAEPDQQEAPFQTPKDVPSNPGDGVFRGQALAQLETADLPNDSDGVLTLEGLRLTEQIRAGALTTLMFAGFSQGTNALNAAHSEIHSAIRSALNAVENHDSERQQLKTAYRQLEKERGDLRQHHEQQAQQAMKSGNDAYRAALKEARQAKQQLDKAQARTEAQLAQTQAAINERLTAQRLATLSQPLEAIRQSMPNLLPGLRLVPLATAIQQGKYILGLEDLSADGERVTPDTEHTGQTRVWVLDRDKPSTQALSRLSEAQNELILAQKAVEQATANSAEAQERLAAAQQRFASIGEELDALGGRATAVAAAIRATEQAMEQHQSKLGSAEQSRLFRVLNTPVLPMVVLGIEVVNVWNAFSTFSETRRARGFGRAVWGAGSASYNSVIASMLLAERFANDLVKDRLAVFFAYEFDNDTARSIAKAFGADSLTMRMVLGATGGLVATGISLSDTLYSLNTGDPAAWGYGVTTASGVFITLAAMVPAQATLLGLGPLGWIGLALMLGGTALIMVLQDEPIENWLRNGPFGNHDGLPHLQGEANAVEAYYRLVGLLINLRLTYQPVPLVLSVEAQGMKAPLTPDFRALQEATHTIRIDSNLPGLVGSPGIEAVCEVQLLSQSRRLGRDSAPMSKRPASEDLQQSSILHQQATPTGHIIYVKTPDTHRGTQRLLGISTSEYEIRYSWQAKAQYRVNIGEEPFAFPAPEPKDTTRYDSDNPEHTEPEFEDDDQLYWVNGFAKPSPA